MADSLADLFVRLSGDTSDFKAAFQDASDQLDKFAESAGGISGVVEALTGLAEALGVVEGLKALSDLGEQFEEASNKIVTLTGAMGDALESLEGAFTTVFTSVPQGMQDVAAAVGALSAILHPTADDLADLSTQLLNLSRITGESIGPLVTDTAHLFQQWGLDVQDGAAALDHFNQVAQATGTPVSQIEGMLTQFGPALRNLGVDATQAADLIGTLAQQGLNAQQILAGMQRAEANLGKAGVTDLAAGFQMLVGAIQNASSAGQALQIGAAAFGARGAGPIVAAIQSGSIDFTTFQNQIDTTNESIDDQAARVETLGQKWSTFVNQLENDLKPAAELIVGFLEGILTAAESVVSGIESLWDTIAHPPSLPNMTEGIATGDQANEIAQLQAIIANHNQQLGAKQINVSPLDSTGANVLTATQYINNMTAALQAAGGKALDFGYAVTTATDGTITLSAAVDGTGKAAGNSANAFDQWLAKTTSGYKLLKEQLTNLQQAYQMQSGTGIIQLQISNLQRQVGNPNYGDQLTQYDNYLNEKIKLAKASGQAISDDDVANAAHTAALLQQMTMTTPAAFTLLGISGTDTLETQEQLIQAALDKITSSAYATDDDITRATQAALDKDIALWRQYGAEVTDSSIQSAANMKAAWAQAHMDLQQAFSTLGVTSSNDSVNSYLTQLAAVAKIQQSFNEGTATSDDLANAQIAALSKEQAALAALGEAMSDADVSQLAYLQNQKQIAAMTTQGAFTNLGMASPDQLQNNLDLITASYAKVVAVVGESGSQADTAWLDFLTKAISQTQAAGEQIGDGLASAFEAAQAQVQLDAVNIVNAFSGLAVTSGQKLAETVALVQTQMNTALLTVAVGSSQADQIVLSGLTAIQAAYQKSGSLVPQDLADQIQALQAKMATALMTTQQAYTTLGVTSEATYQNQIAAAQHALDILNATGAPIQALIQGNEDLLAIQIKFGTLQGDDVTAYIEQLQNAKMQTDALTQSSQGLGNVYVSLTNSFTNAFGTLSKGIADNLIDWKNWGTTISGIIDTMAKQILETLVGYAFKQLELEILKNTNLIQGLSQTITDLIGGNLSSIGSDLASIFGAPVGNVPAGTDSAANQQLGDLISAQLNADAEIPVNSTALGTNTTAIATDTTAEIANTAALVALTAAIGVQLLKSLPGGIPNVQSNILPDMPYPDTGTPGQGATGGESGLQFTQLGISAMQALGLIIQANTTAVAAGTAAAGAVRLTTQDLVAQGNVVQAQFEQLTPALADNTLHTQMASEAITFDGQQMQDLGGYTQDLATGVRTNTGALGDNTAVIPPNTAAIPPNTDALDSMAKDLGNLGSGGAGGGGGIPGGGGTDTTPPVNDGNYSDLVTSGALDSGTSSALSGVTSTLASLGTSVAGVVGMGVQIASMVVQGDELAQIDNKLWVLVSSNQGILNQLISLQNSANQYWPQLLHLTDIWASVQPLSLQMQGLVQDFLEAVTSMEGLSSSGSSLGDNPVLGALQADGQLMGQWLPELSTLTDIDSQAQQTFQQLLQANATLNAIETYFQRVGVGTSSVSAAIQPGAVTDTSTPAQTTALQSGMLDASKASSDNTVAVNQNTVAVSDLHGPIGTLADNAKLVASGSASPAGATPAESPAFTAGVQQLVNVMTQMFTSVSPGLFAAPTQALQGIAQQLGINTAAYATSQFQIPTALIQAIAEAAETQWMASHPTTTVAGPTAAQQLSGLGTGYAIPASGLTAPGALQGGEIIDPSIVSGNTAALTSAASATQATLPAMADNTAAILAQEQANTSAVAANEKVSAGLNVVSSAITGATEATNGLITITGTATLANGQVIQTMAQLTASLTAQQSAAQGVYSQLTGISDQLQQAATALYQAPETVAAVLGKTQAAQNTANDNATANSNAFTSGSDITGNYDVSGTGGPFSASALSQELSSIFGTAITVSTGEAASLAMQAVQEHIAMLNNPLSAGDNPYQIQLAPGVMANPQGGIEILPGVEGGPPGTGATTMPVANPYAVPLTTVLGNFQVAQGGGEPGTGPAPAQNTQVVQPGTYGPSPLPTPTWTPSNYAPVNTNSIGAFSYPNGVPPAVGAPSSSSSPSSVNNNLTVIANTSASRDILKGFVQGVNQMGISLR